MPKPSFYIASKTIHAAHWRQLREKGYQIISTWIDEAEKGQTADMSDLARRCITEPKKADYTILYCQPGELLKYALVEVGAALASNKPVFVIGHCESISPTMLAHFNCYQVSFSESLETVEQVMHMLEKAPSHLMHFSTIL